MVFIPAGEFLRGYNGGGFDEKPEGWVMLDAYWIDRYEGTYGAYTAFVTATGHRKPVSRYVKHFDKLSAPTQPAVYVSWEDTDAYCRYRGARLPTEAEWEKAAMGTNGLCWPWGNQDKLGAANTGNPDPYEFPAPVASFPVDQSPYGVYDMAGNVMEWVADWYQEDAYRDASPNPKGLPTGSFKVIRGSVSIGIFLVPVCHPFHDVPRKMPIETLRRIPRACRLAVLRSLGEHRGKQLERKRG